MKQPTVTAVCLTADRQAYTDRAVKSFVEQTYENSRLLIYDTGKTPYYTPDRFATSRISIANEGPERAGAIGKLRNAANALTTSDVLIHFDSDDWSAPHRIQESVSLLVNSNADVVGYNNLFFWDSVKGEAWEYKHPDHKFPVGASLCYWREMWARKPFQETSSGEDWHFVQGTRMSAMTSLQSYGENPGKAEAWRPMLVAEVHGGNTCTQIKPGHKEWKRQPGWDARLKLLMVL